MINKSKIEAPENFKLDPEFKFEIAQTHEGKTVLKCFQCGMCTSSCPYSELLDVKPHQVIRMVHLGMRDQALTCKTVWVCSTCFMCNERCPQGVELANVMFALKNIAAIEKGIPNGLKMLGQSILKLGRSLEVTEYHDMERLSLGLPKTPTVNVESVRRLLSKTKFDELVAYEEGEK